MKNFKTTLLALLLVSSSLLTAQVTRWDAYKTQVTQLQTLAKTQSWAQAEAARQALSVSLEAEVNAKMLAFRQYAVEKSKQTPAPAQPEKIETEEMRLDRTQNKTTPQNELSMLKQRNSREQELSYFIKTVKITDAGSANLVQGYAAELVSLLSEDEKIMSKK